MALQPADLSPERQPDGQLSTEKSRQMNEIAQRDGMHRFEWYHRKIDGEIFPVEVVLNPVDIDGKPAMIAVWHDLTERKKYEENLQRMADKLKADLVAASEIQRALLPNSSPLIKGIKVAWSYEPCDELGGDSLNYFPLDNNYVGFYVLDVTGHGVAASLLSVTVSHLLSPFSPFSFLKNPGASECAVECPSEVVKKLNDHFSANHESNQFFSLLYGVLNLETREFTYVSAGHPHPLLVSSEKGARFLPAAGLPVGIFPDAEYEPRSVQLEKGERIYLYSDGILEARDPDGEFYGVERFEDLSQSLSVKSLGQSIQIIVKDVKDWCGHRGADDDISLLALEIAEEI